MDDRTHFVQNTEKLMGRREVGGHIGLLSAGRPGAVIASWLVLLAPTHTSLVYHITTRWPAHLNNIKLSMAPW